MKRLIKKVEVNCYPVSADLKNIFNNNNNFDDVIKLKIQ